MEAVRSSWTDDRMDDLNGKVDAMHAEMRSDSQALRSEILALRTDLDARFDSLHRSLVVMTAATMSTMVAGFGSLLVTQL